MWSCHPVTCSIMDVPGLKLVSRVCTRMLLGIQTGEMFKATLQGCILCVCVCITGVTLSMLYVSPFRVPKMLVSRWVTILNYVKLIHHQFTYHNNIICMYPCFGVTIMMLILNVTYTNDIFIHSINFKGN